MKLITAHCQNNWLISSSRITHIPWKVIKRGAKLNDPLHSLLPVKSKERLWCWKYQFRLQIVPGGRMLSLSRMRAEAKSLMMYCRRTYLNTERNPAPSSVFKKGSLSHRSAEEIRNPWVEIKNMACKGFYFIRFVFFIPVRRLQSQASASARSCLMGPSHAGLSCRNIHCRRNMTECLKRKGNKSGGLNHSFSCVPFSELCTRPSPPAWQTGRTTGWAAPSLLPCTRSTDTNTEHTHRWL